MDFINKQNSARCIFSLLNNFTNIFYTRTHRTYRVKWSFDFVGNNICNRSLPNAWRSPQNHRRYVARLHCFSDDSIRAHQVLLPDEVIECGRPHTFSQRWCGIINKHLKSNLRKYVKAFVNHCISKIKMCDESDFRSTEYQRFDFMFTEFCKHFFRTKLSPNFKNYNVGIYWHH